jgi:hypothetical protein
MHVKANIRLRANIRYKFSHAGEYLLQNIRFEANIHKISSEFHIQASIRFIFAYILFEPDIPAHPSRQLIPPSHSYRRAGPGAGGGGRTS